MKRILSLAAYAALLLSLLASCTGAGTEASPSPYISPPPAPEEPSEPSVDPSPDGPLDADGLFWKVAPTYDEITYMYWASILVYDDRMLYLYSGEEAAYDGSDHATGGLPPPDEWLYDQGKNLYGHYGTDEEYTAPSFKTFTQAEFEAFCNGYQTLWTGIGPERLRVFRQIDADLVRTIDNEDEFYRYDLSDAYIGDTYALAFGSAFVTGFIYDVAPWGLANTRWATDVFAMSLDGRWGVIDKNGNTVVPHIFEHLILINDDAAFAKHGDKYGILDIEEARKKLG